MPGQNGELPFYSHSHCYIALLDIIMLSEYFYVSIFVLGIFLEHSENNIPCRFHKVIHCFHLFCFLSLDSTSYSLGQVFFHGNTVLILI